MRLRISEELAQSGGLLQDLMSFFKGSQVGSKLAKFEALKSFPKISTRPNPKSSIEVAKFWDTPQPYAELHPDDKGKLLECLQPYTIYNPLEKSASSDMIYVPEEGIVEFQCKLVLKPFSITDIIVEAQKTFYAYASKQRPVTFVVVALNVSEDLSNLNPGATSHLYFKPGTKFSHNAEIFVIPKFMDIIVLLEEGMKEFLTSPNLTALKALLNSTHAMSLDKVARAIASPSKKK